MIDHNRDDIPTALGISEEKKEEIEKIAYNTAYSIIMVTNDKKPSRLIQDISTYGDKFSNKEFAVLILKALEKYSQLGIAIEMKEGMNEIVDEMFPSPDFGENSGEDVDLDDNIKDILKEIEEEENKDE